MKVNRWGNSLAIRIPGEVSERLGLREGDEVMVRVDEAGAFRVSRDDRRDRAIESLASLGWEIPSDFRFDRDAAHERG